MFYEVKQNYVQIMLGSGGFSQRKRKSAGVN